MAKGAGRASRPRLTHRILLERMSVHACSTSTCLDVLSFLCVFTFLLSVYTWFYPGRGGAHRYSHVVVYAGLTSWWLMTLERNNDKEHMMDGGDRSVCSVYILFFVVVLTAR